MAGFLFFFLPFAGGGDKKRLKLKTLERGVRRPERDEVADALSSSPLASNAKRGDRRKQQGMTKKKKVFAHLQMDKVRSGALARRYKGQGAKSSDAGKQELTLRGWPDLASGLAWPARQYMCNWIRAGGDHFRKCCFLVLLFLGIR